MTRAKRQRSIAFHTQGGRCFYCCQPMWLSDPASFARQRCISLAQTLRFQCTAEHLRPKAEGGTLCRSNVVAACFVLQSNEGKSVACLGAGYVPSTSASTLSLGQVALGLSEGHS